MADYSKPIITSEDVALFLEWLRQKDEIGKSVIQLVIETIISLEEDRQRLLKELDNVQLR